MDEAALPSRRDLWIHMLVYPGHTLPTALAPVLVAAGLAFHDGVFAAGRRCSPCWPAGWSSSAAC